jgi:hypothetical protein
MVEKHLIIIDPQLIGREYGTLVAFQKAVVEHTKADIYFLKPKSYLEERLFQTSKFRFLRNFFLKKVQVNLKEKYGVLWYICMGPENFRLDLYSGFGIIPNRVLYFFDTLPHQFELIKKLKLNRYFTHRITSFSDARDPLERYTNYRWYYFAQASVNPNRIIESVDNKHIAFCSYGRGNTRLNKLVRLFCQLNSLHFECTHEGQGVVKTNNIELYENYLWHTSQSVFNICFSVEITDPLRAVFLSPITCRWFEAVLSRNIIIGIAPLNREFRKLFPDNLVQSITLESSDDEILEWIGGLWESRAEIFSSIYGGKNESFFLKFQWESRVFEICDALLL